MKGSVLVIGGAGFIGSHTTDELFWRGYKIRVLDSLHPGVHFGKWPEWVKPQYQKIKGDARNPRTVAGFEAKKDESMKGESRLGR